MQKETYRFKIVKEGSLPTPYTIFSENEDPRLFAERGGRIRCHELKTGERESKLIGEV